VEKKEIYEQEMVTNKYEFTIKDLEEVITAFEKERVNYMVVGGWAWDGLEGRITRKHADLDVLCLGYEPVEKALNKAGYALKRRTNDLVEFEKESKRVDVGVLRKGEEIVKGKNGIINVKPADFKNATIKTLENVMFKIAPLHVLEEWMQTSNTK